MENLLSQKLRAELNRFNTNGETLRLAPDGEVFFTSPYKNEVNIGNISIQEDRVIYRKKENESHILRNINGWSINRTILNVVDDIHYTTEEATYQITKKKAQESGKLQTKHSFGLDDKIVIPLPYWTKQYKSKEKQLAIQLFGESWGLQLHPLLSDPEFKKISKRIKEDRKITGVNPSSDKVFRAFHLTPFEDLCMVVVGTQPDDKTPSNGLAYQSTDLNRGLLHTVSNLIEEQVYSGFMLDKHIDTEKWATQGILMLNKNLTTPYGYPNGHKDIGWNYFCTYVLCIIALKKPETIFFTWETETTEFVNSVFKTLNSTIQHITLKNETNTVFKDVTVKIKETFHRTIDW